MSNIIIIEKNEEISNNANNILKLDDCTVSKYSSLNEVLPILQKEKIDALIVEPSILSEELQNSKKQMETVYLESVETLRLTVEAKDNYTRGHSDRVAAYSVLIGQKLDLSPEEIRTLRIGGTFHDIGKIGIPDSILLKTDKLTAEEYEEIKKHPIIGKDILSNSLIFKDIIPIVLYHHERYDGTGYPYGLSGKGIPFLARIVAVADAFDAMTTKRSYRPTLDIEDVKNEIRNNSGTQFDPLVASTILEIIDNDFDTIKQIQNAY